MIESSRYSLGCDDEHRRELFDAAFGATSGPMRTVFTIR